jgi:RecA-family ATPase
MKVDANDVAREKGVSSLRDLIDEAARWDHRQSFNGHREFADDGRNGDTAPPQALTISEWRARNLPDPDYLMGKWMTTTSRILQIAPRGIGKTTLMLHLGMAAAAGVDFLHWSGHRPCKLLYVDGEMSRRLLRQRMMDAARRLGDDPPEFYALSHEDIPDFRPLNTPAGQQQIEREIEKIGGIDF